MRAEPKGKVNIKRMKRGSGLQHNAACPFDLVNPPDPMPELPARRDQKDMRLAHEIRIIDLQPPPKGE